MKSRLHKYYARVTTICYNTRVMSRVCEICEKKSQKGKKITLIWGVKYRSIRHRKPNLRKTTLLLEGQPVQVNVCANCLKSVKNGKYPGVAYPDYANADVTTEEKTSETNQ